ncbi:hypothetical protein EJ08DRAFT_646890, partial [Tothia fuscella]
MDALKRHSLGAKLLNATDRRGSHGSSKSPKMEPRKCAKISIKVESPPLVSYNIPANSSGALFSARLDVDVADPNVVFESFEMKLNCVYTVKKPVQPNCPECTTQKTELKSWDFANEKLKLSPRKHDFPFSYLFPGHLPATTHAPLVSVEYHLSATAKTNTGETITFTKPIHLYRAIIPAPNDKNSMRIFPPTNLTIRLSLQPVIHPIGDFPVSLRLAGITTKGEKSDVRWRLRKMNWRIEERQKVISPACAKHCAKLGGEGKGILHEDVRNVGEGDIDYHKTPWKCDFDAGEVDAEFSCAVKSSKNPVCDVEADNGLLVTHSLVLEMVVAEEWVPKHKPKEITPTGAARILRTQFKVILSERGGLGIAWDEETPPVYEDVPASPPGYGGDVVYEELAGSIEDFHLDSNTGLATTARASSSRTDAAPDYTAHPATFLQRRNVLSADDLLLEPYERANDTAVEQEEEDDVQIIL